MGLDQYGHATNISKEEYKNLHNTKTGDTILENKEESIKLMYWRKHNRLQGYMEQLYINSSDDCEKSTTFNLTRLYLSKEDIDNLENAILSKTLPKTAGFSFFGEDSYKKEEGEKNYPDMENDLEFIEKARKALNDGLHVYYIPWW